MTRLFNDPAAFADETIDGFVAAHRRWVRQVPGGVARNTATPDGRVAVIIGGGSGHYPAFAGLVGQGLADAAVMGNVFASPSAAQIVAVASAAEHGGGVLLSYGNYAGDALNFSQAQERLRGQGLDCRTVRVTDDISSAPVEARHQRRGIAGDLVVFKIAGAAAAEGHALDQVVEFAERANERTRTLGVAFSGCTLPGASEPLFSVPEGRMAIGLGIHGEPGLGEVDVPTAAELAELLVVRLLAELPDDVGSVRGHRLVPILNGLGSVKYEELFVVFATVNRLLEERGVEIVDAVVGEVCTSFDMAGLSLTLFWPDEELARLWAAPADAPAFRTGSVSAPALARPAQQPATPTVVPVPPASAESRDSARLIAATVDAIATALDEHADELGRIDAVAGDGDHGIGMQRGSRAAAGAAHAAAEAGAGAGTVLTRSGDAWADRAGGTSGALWGVALRRLGEAVGDEHRPTGTSLARGVHAARIGICDFGGAQLGDKTMVDALAPFDDTLHAAIARGATLRDAWDLAATAAEQAAARTADLLPLKGRARPHAEKSLGTPDAGAVSFGILVRTVHTTLLAHRPTTSVSSD